MKREHFLDVLKENKWDLLKDFPSDQRKGISSPPHQKAYPADSTLVDLINPEKFSFETLSVLEAIRNRRSIRKFTDEILSLEELSYLLWATQGVHKVAENNVYTLRSVPSAGARHPFETYLVINRIDTIPPGLYRYLPLNHKLVLVTDKSVEEMAENLNVTTGTTWIAKGAVVFIWTAIPYKTEWRYTYLALSKLLGQDSGHLCQNLYLACESIGIGTCAVGAFGQEAIDNFLGIDGEEEFAIYIAPVGKKEKK